MNRRRIALDTAIVLGFSLFLLGLSTFYVMFLRPGHGDFTICGQDVSTSCWEDSSGPIFMFSVLFGGAALFCIGAIYRKTAKLNLWESAMLGSIVLLIFDLIILPTSAFFLLPLNGGGMLIFTFFLMSLVGIVFSAFQYIQSGNVGISEIGHKLPILTTPKRNKVYALILIAGLMIAVSLFLAPAIVYGGGWHSCYTHPGRLSFQISNYAQLVGPPLYSEKQFLLTPGSTTYLTYVYNATGDGNNFNISDWFALYRWPSQPWSPERVDLLTGQTYSTTVNQSGVAETFQNVSYRGSYVALVLYKIAISDFAPPSTYVLSISCDPGLLLTIGDVPYWGPLPYGEIQPMAFLFNTAISIIGSSLLITTLHIRYSSGKKEGQENTDENQLTPQ